MATPLHEVDALVSIAEGPPGPARDWATSRLAVIAPDRFRVFPAGDDVHDTVLAADPPALVPSIIEVLRAHGPGGAPCPPGLAATITAMGAFGVLPEQPSELADALRGAMRGDGAEADAWLAMGLASLGEADAEALTKAVRSESPDVSWLLPVLVLRVGERVGALDEAARQVARELASTAASDPNRLRAVIATLGVPTLTDASWVKDPREAAEIGAEIAGGALPGIPSPVGSKRLRTQHYVRHLLEGVEGPVAALLRALYQTGTHPEWGLWPVVIAAWLRTFVPGDPLFDVLDRAAGADVRSLTVARRQVGPEHRPKIAGALAERGEGAIAVVAAPLVAKGDVDLARDVVDLLLEVGPRDARLVALASFAAWHCADRIPDLLLDRVRRNVGLLVAEWVPTEEVLAALLEMEVPADEAVQIQYSRCLAAMGDSAVIPTLAALVAADEQGIHAPARALAESILGIPLA